MAANIKPGRKRQPSRTSTAPFPILTLTLALLLAVLSIIVVRNGWLNDDAFITFRTIDNFLDSYGLRWNIIERVQTYTHPLWMLLMTAAAGLTGNLPMSAFYISFALSIATAVVIAFRLAVDKRNALLLLHVMLLSKTFIDFTSSGLENPLSYIIAATFAAVFFTNHLSKRRTLILFLLASAATLTRMDHLLLYLPALAFHLWRERDSGWFRQLALGLTPLIVWFVFSLIYYGFLFPNTAYAKLNTGISTVQYISQGIAYIQYSFLSDPLGIITIAAGLLLPFLARNQRQTSLALGLLLYLVYVIYVGGDFMVGRFLSVPLVIALCLLSQIPMRSHAKSALVGGAIILLLGFTVSHSPLASGKDYGQGEGYWTDINAHRGICDERAFYYPQLGFLNRSQMLAELKSRHRTVVSPSTDKRAVRVDGRIGVISYLSTPATHIIDLYALTDPLLARLPAQENEKWRIGHFTRTIPDGYRETLASDSMQISDSSLAVYYGRLSLVTQGRMFDPERWREIMRFLTGANDRLIAEYTTRKI